jgi:hypothetical protein
MDLMDFIDQAADGANLEHLENLEATTEHLVRDLGMSIPQARQKAAQILSKGSASNQMTFGKSAAKAGAAAQFNLKITRNSANIAAILPVPLFGAMDREGKYVQSLGSYMPSGVTLESVANVNGNYVFTYTDGTHTDTITVTCNEIAYASFVLATITDVMSIRAIRYKINSDAQLSQFQNTFASFKKSLFGKREDDTIDVQSNIGPMQYRPDVADIGVVNSPDSVVATVDKDSSLVIGVNAASFSFNLSMFVNRFNKLNAASRL